MLRTVTIFLNRFDTFLQTQVTVLKTDKWSEHFVMVLNRLYILINFTQTVIFLINSLMFPGNHETVLQDFVWWI